MELYLIIEILFIFILIFIKKIFFLLEKREIRDLVSMTELTSQCDLHWDIINRCHLNVIYITIGFTKMNSSHLVNQSKI